MNRPNFNVMLPLLLEILGDICIAIVCLPVCDVINFEVKLSYISNRFPTRPKKSGQKLEYLQNENSF